MKGDYDLRAPNKKHCRPIMRKKLMKLKICFKRLKRILPNGLEFCLIKKNSA